MSNGKQTKSSEVGLTKTKPKTTQNSKIMVGIRYATVLVVAGGAIWAAAQIEDKSELLPPQSVRIDMRNSNVLNGSVFRDDSFASSFNPQNATPPFFQIFDKSFLEVLGETPAFYEVASNETFAFAHEAPIYVAESDQLFFASNAGGDLGMSDWDNNNQVGVIDVKSVESALAQLNGSFTVNVPVTALDLPESVQMTNGGTGPYKSSLLLINSGRALNPPNIVAVHPQPPYNTTVLLDNYYGRQFNSLNDIRVHPSGKIFFTDVTYGYLNHFRPPPLMPNGVYRFDSDTGSVRLVADGFDKPNGLAFTADGQTVYIADTGAAQGFLGLNQTRPATIYAFDVDASTHAFHNRRVFAYVDSGVPDGVQVDTKGNVYSGCADGVHVWSRDGTLIGKFFLGTTSANLVFAGKGRLFILAETKVFLARIAAEGTDLS